MAGTTASTVERLRGRWGRGDAEERRRLIVDVALGLLQAHGPEGATVRRIAARLGVGVMTLYTYYRGQEQVRAAVVRRGFAMLRQGCDEPGAPPTAASWRRGARAYLDFALQNPQLYELMFTTPMAAGLPTDQALTEEFQPFLEMIREDLRNLGLSRRQVERQARLVTGRVWIGMHGLASLAIARRLHVLRTDLDRILDDLLPRITPQGLRRSGRRRAPARRPGPPPRAGTLTPAPPGARLRGPRPRD